MKIIRVEPIHLRLPDVNERCDGSQETLIVKVHTDAGLVGVGEVDSSALVAKAIIEAPLSHKICRGLAECVLGQDPFEIDRLIHRMYEGTIFFGRQGAVIQAMSGIEIALWDLAGKATQRPVYQLLGGAFRKQFRAYASILFGDTPAETERIGRNLVQQGFRAVKFGWGPMGLSEESDLAQVRAARQGLGPDIEVMVAAGLCWATATAIRRARQFEQFNLTWLEEPLHPDNIQGYARLCANSPMRIAAGEEICDVAEFRHMMDVGGIDVAQVDVTRVGGLARSKRIGWDSYERLDAFSGRNCPSARSRRRRFICPARLSRSRLSQRDRSLSSSECISGRDHPARYHNRQSLHRGSKGHQTIQRPAARWQKGN